MKKLLAVQKPYFLTWLGTYFFIYHSDTFIALDTAVFDKKKDVYKLWHKNTFNVDSQDGERSLTIPIHFGTKPIERVNEIEIKHEIFFTKKHLNSIKEICKDLKYTEEVLEQILMPIYFKKHRFLIHFNMDVIFSVCKYLGIKTDHIKRSSELEYEVSEFRKEKYFDYLEKENCQFLMVDEGLGELLTPEEDISEFMLIDDFYANHQGEQDRLFYCPIKQILPTHFNILDLLCKYGKDTIKFIQTKDEKRNQK